MRAAAFLLLAATSLAVASAAAAQPALFPGGTGPTRTAAPHWRLAGGAGFALSGESAAVSVSAERSVAGPFAVGGRGVAYVEGGFLEDGGSTKGGAAEAFASVASRDRVLDLRAFAGVGVTAVLRSSGGFEGGGVGEFRAASTEDGVVGPHLVGGVGLDLYPLAGVGLGVEARGVLAPAVGTSVSTVAVGLRVRLAR